MASCDITRGGTCTCRALPHEHLKVLRECEAEAWRNVESGDPDAHSEADVAADIVQRLHHLYRVVAHDDGLNIPPPEQDAPTSYEPTEEEYQELVADMKREILEDLGTARSTRGSFLPLSTSSFSMLHDYVDANEYGGLCDDERRAHWVVGEAGVPTLNRAQTEIDEWLASGEARTEKIAMWLYDATYDPPGIKVGWSEVSENARQHWLNHAKRMQADLLVGIEEGVI